MKCFAPAHVITALATLLTVADALSIQSSQIENTAADTTDSFLTLEKTWTVASAEQLHSLFVHTPTNVFVAYDASLKASSSDIVAKIVVSGDSRELIDVFEVVPQETNYHHRGYGYYAEHQEQQQQQHLSNREDAIKLQLKNVDATVHGHVLTRIFVADRSVLRDLSAGSTRDVVVGEAVLASSEGASASVSLSIAGSGNMFVTSSEKFAVESLKLSVAGSGDVQFDVPSIQAADDVKLSIAGSGRIAIQARDVTAKKLEASVAGSGDVYVQSDDLKVHDLKSEIAGSGAVNLSKSGSCTKQKVSISGSGFVATGSVVCEDTDVSIAGQGDVIVQSTDRLKVSAIASGSVKYVNSRPKTLTQSTLLSHNSIVSQAEKNEFKTCATVPTPPQSPIQIQLELRKNLYSNDPNIIAHEETSDLAARMTTNFAASSEPRAVGESVLSVVGIAGIALATVGALVGKLRQNKREEYAPLV